MHSCLNCKADEKKKRLFVLILHITQGNGLMIHYYKIIPILTCKKKKTCEAYTYIMISFISNIIIFKRKCSFLSSFLYT